jgi:L,D-transpeptidase catalytic domain
MPGNRTVAPSSRWLVSLHKVALVLGVAGLMLGAHHRLSMARCAANGCAPAPPSPRVLAGIHTGHAGAATLRRWESARSFRRVAEPAWGRRAALDSAQLLTILKINRIDASHLRGRQLMVPDSIAEELAYSPLPARLPELAKIPKFVLVSRRVQAFGAYEDGVLVRWGPTSTGKEATPTDSGLFFTNWKSKRAISTDDPSWILDWYVNFIALKGVAFHEYALPGRPASHGCVRLLEQDAYWIYRWVDQWVPGRGRTVKEYGTPVLLMGDYDYRAAPPWQGLAENPDADRVSAGEAVQAVLPYLGTVVERSGVERTDLALRR